MKVTLRMTAALALGALWTLLAAAQEPAAPSTPAAPSSAQAEAGEPRADTSAPAPPAAASTPASVPAAAAPAAGAPTTSAPAARTAGVRSRPAAAGPKDGASPKPTAVDRLDLGVATVTGDREQPKVMYVVPWKRSDIGDLSGKPMNSLLDEALAPVDREEFKREVVYFQAVQADASQNGAAKPKTKGEK